MKHNDALAKAVEIFKELHWDQADPSEVLQLEIGDAKQRKIARDGLAKGDWSRGFFDENDKYRTQSLIDVDRNMLACFAIRVGVDARRAVELAPVGRPVAQVVASRGSKYAEEVIDRTCRPDFRAWEHAFAYGAGVAMWLGTLPDFTIPAHVGYLRDWACLCADRITDYPAELLTDEPLPEKEDLKLRFYEHLVQGVQLNVPATGPFGALIPAAIDIGWLTRQQGFNLVLQALECAQRPGDRKKWSEILSETLAITTEEIAAHGELFAGLLATGEAPLVEKFGVPLIGSATGIQLGDIAMSCLFVKTGKALTAVLKALYARLEKLPENDRAELCSLISPRVIELANQRNAGVKKAATTLLSLCEVRPDTVVADTEADSLPWRSVPPLWDLPLFDAPSPGISTLAHLVETLNVFEGSTSDVRDEEFVVVAHQLLRSDSATFMRGIGRLNEYFFNQATSRILSPWEAPEWEVSVTDMRTQAVLCYAEAMPALLSTPTCVDYSISVADFCARIAEYEKAGLPVYAPDFLLAVFRLVDLKDAAMQLTSCAVGIIGIDNSPVAKNVAEVLDLLSTHEELNSRMYGEPSTKESNQNWFYYEFPKLLRTVPNLLHPKMAIKFNYQVFPRSNQERFDRLVWSPYNYSKLGHIASQAARSIKPLESAVAVNLLGAQRDQKPEVRAECRQALVDAFNRGLIEPEKLDATDLDRSNFPKNLAGFAHAMREVAEEGLLSVVWPVLDGLLVASGKSQRLFAGTAEIAALMADLAPSVAHALAVGDAPAHNGAVPGLRALARRNGKSQAVVMAREAVAALPDHEGPTAEVVDKQTAAESIDFDTQWIAGASEKPRIVDGARLSGFRLADSHTKKKTAELTLDIPGFDEPVIVNKSGWFYDIEAEAQVQCEKGGESGFLYFESGKFFFSRWRNRKDNTHAPLAVKPTKHSDFIFLVVIGCLASEYEVEWARNCVTTMMREGTFCPPETVQEATQQLVQFAEFSPARCVWLIDKNPMTAAYLWPIITASLQHAASKETPPMWTAKVLACALNHATLFAEATRRGKIPAEQWDSLSVLAQAKKKTAAKTKAQQLRDILFGSAESR
ncbi:hypothetical protein CMUST_01880 [Corynebacterium mustelae]|uniref:Uncharacterized protein n=1 Tax=Corynebacterium mustelae TaxID=571915 RepID=A0A0G3GU89_9CORY|nr:hypothetical protein [Corynebacterium mustelae]AKK04721.1 hypothetical protein CMUST_01880 [Corynebacterium mustelae]